MNRLRERSTRRFLYRLLPGMRPREASRPTLRNSTRPRLEGLEARQLLAAPVGGPDHYATPEDVTLSVPAFAGTLANDTDPDGENLEAVLVTGPSHGSLTLLGDGSFTYKPALNYFGSDSFVYKPWDGTTPLDAIAPVSVPPVVNAVDDAPVASVDRFTAVEGKSLSVSAPGVLVNDYPTGNPS
jgi:hypothetical protein